MSEKHIGKVLQVIGPVLDIQFHHGIEPGVADLYRIVLALEISFRDLAGQLEALAHRDICRQQHLLREQGHLVVDEILCRALADGQHQHFAFFGPGLLEHVGIVSTEGRRRNAWLVP